MWKTMINLWYNLYNFVENNFKYLWWVVNNFSLWSIYLNVQSVFTKFIYFVIQNSAMLS